MKHIPFITMIICKQADGNVPDVNLPISSSRQRKDAFSRRKGTNLEIKVLKS